MNICVQSVKLCYFILFLPSAYVFLSEQSSLLPDRLQIPQTSWWPLSGQSPCVCIWTPRHRSPRRSWPTFHTSPSVCSSVTCAKVSKRFKHSHFNIQLLIHQIKTYQCVCVSPATLQPHNIYYQDQIVLFKSGKNCTVQMNRQCHKPQDHLRLRAKLTSSPEPQNVFIQSGASPSKVCKASYTSLFCHYSQSIKVIIIISRRCLSISSCFFLSLHSPFAFSSSGASSLPW